MKDETRIGSQEQRGGITAKDVVDNSKVEIRDNHGPVQYNENSPGSSQIVNQRRTINPQARIEKTQRDGDHILQIILNQTGGFWDQGTAFQISAKVSGPYKKAEIIQGLPPARFNEKIGDHQEKGEYFYSSTTAPFPDSPIVLEIVSAQDIDLEKLGVAPLAQ